MKNIFIAFENYITFLHRHLFWFQQDGATERIVRIHAFINLGRILIRTITN